jgi:enoyl-[acyl-carrier protein] reductase I
MAGVLEGRRGLIMGVANERSIAWGIAQQARAQGAELAFTYAGEALQKRVFPLAESLGSDLVLPCDVQSDDDIRDLFAELGGQWDKLDFLVHAVAYANKEELKDSFLDTTREGFRIALDISAYSLVGVVKEAMPLLREGSSVLTLTYLGAERLVPHYNVMGVAKAALEACVRYLASDLGPRGIRVNAISAGPLRTLAAAGIGDFRKIFDWYEAGSPLRRNVTQEEVGNAALLLLSELGRGITAEVIHVDGGYHAVAVPNMVELLGREESAS